MVKDFTRPTQPHKREQFNTIRGVSGHIDLYLTIHNTHKRQISMPVPPARFEPTISAGERSQTYALDLAAKATGNVMGFRIPIF